MDQTTREAWEAEQADAPAYAALLAPGAAFPPELVQAGKDAHAAGKAYHEGPQPFFTVKSLCWRKGWNEAAGGRW